MRLPFQRKKHDNLDEARQARVQAERDLEATRAETPKYQALGRALHDLRESNHLAETLANAFRK